MKDMAIALLCAALYGAYYFQIKLAAGNIHQILGAVILQVIAAITGIVLLVMLKANGVQFTVSKQGIAFAVGAGLAVGLAEITQFTLYSRGLSVTIGTPIIVGASILVAGILGVLFLKEILQPLHLVGAICIVIGVILMTR